MCSLFSDISFFDELVAERLKQAIIDCDHIALNFITVKKFTENYFSVHDFRSEEGKETFKQIKTIFQTLCVRIVSKKPEVVAQYYEDVTELRKYFPDIHFLCDDKKVLLLKFRNMIMACLSVIEARLNKQTIIDIAGRLEGTQRPYITGKGQRDDVTRRVRIYESEGKIAPEVRWYRRHPQGPSSGSSSPACSSISSADSPKIKKRKTFFDAPEGPKKAKKQDKLRPGRLPTLEKKRRPEPAAQDFAHVHPSMNEPDLFPSSLPRHPSAYYGPCDEKRESQSFYSAPSFPPSLHAFVTNSASAAPAAVPAYVPITDDAAHHTAGHAEVVPDVSTGDYESLQDLGFCFSDTSCSQYILTSSQ